MAVEITLNEPEHRYEAHVDGELAGFAVFRLRDRIVFTHTEVDDRFEGQGSAPAGASRPRRRAVARLAAGGAIAARSSGRGSRSTRSTPTW